MASPVAIIHLSDLHFGGFADLKQIEALEEFLPSLDATALVVSGDLSQRARHGEFQAAHVFLQLIRQADVQGARQQDRSGVGGQARQEQTQRPWHCIRSRRVHDGVQQKRKRDATRGKR